MTTVVEAARRALHARMAIACQAAAPMFPANAFAVWSVGDSFAVRSSVPALGFLTTLSVSEGPDPAAFDAVMDDARWEGLRPRVMMASDPDTGFQHALARRGFVTDGTRPMAVRVPPVAGEPRMHPDGKLVVGPVAYGHLDEAVAVLLSGYAAGDAVSRFIAAEHRDPRVHLFGVREDSGLVAVAAISFPDQTAVLGGASTLPGNRGRGAQAMLLQARLILAAAEGCTEAVATAASHSPSFRNLVRAGFAIHPRPSFMSARPSVSCWSPDA